MGLQYPGGRETAMIALIDYDMGNLGSVAKALTSLGAKFRMAANGGGLSGADCAILPGVGNFGDGMESLRARGFDTALREFLDRGGWLLGICLGMQMMLEASDEAPGEVGLGFFPGRVRKFDASRGKVPQIGWNSVRFVPGHPLAAGLPEQSWFYFVHSYFVEAGHPAAIGTTEYLKPFTSAIGQGRCFATQFHPEKSQRSGMLLLRNFLVLAGEK